MATQPIDDTGADDDAGAVNDAAPQLTEVEQIAADMGWKPQKDFTGPEGKWRPAKDFILKGKEMQDGLRDTVKDLKRTVDQMASAGAKMTERALREQAAEIEARHAEAIENKDAKGAAQAVRDMDALESEARGLKKDNPEKDFAEKNPWYGSNRKATALAIMVSQEEAGKGATVAEQLEAVEKAVKAEFPELYGQDTALPGKKPAEVAQPNGRSTNVSRAKGPADLPANVKAAMESYVAMFTRKMGDKADPDKIRAQYAKDYFADQA